MNYSLAQTNAWDTLTPLEQSALTLVVVNGRSKQEAALIMNLAAYKFTEIYLRARKFFLLFTEYYDKFGTLIPDSLVLSNDEILFLKLIISKRKSPNDVVTSYEAFRSLVRYRNRANLWNNILNQVQSAGDHGQGFLNLLIEFDKWNAYRILPKNFREPSPFSRRRVKEFKKILSSMLELAECNWDLVLENFETKKPPMVHVSFAMGGQIKTWTVKLSAHSLAYYTRNRIPAFNTQAEAEVLSRLIFDFKNLKRRSPYMAQKFWANFRVELSKAENFNELLGIKLGDQMELTEKDRLFIEKARQKYKPKTARVGLTKEGKFWV